MNGLMGKEWVGLETLPSNGYIAVANHVSEADPVAVAHAVYRAGHTPHFLAKDSLFTIPLLGRLMRGLQQVPVARADRRESQKSLEAAHEVLAQRGCIIIYPEGTLTRDPELWPMRCKSGAARLALATGAPLIPISQWGVQEFLGPYAKLPRIIPRPRYRLRVGREIDLSDLRGGPLTRSVLADATERVEAALTSGVAELRGEDPPEGIWDRGARCRVPRNQSSAAGRDNKSRHEKLPTEPAAGEGEER